MTGRPRLLARLRRRWQLAGWLATAEQSGRTLIDLPAWLAPEVRALQYQRQVERASEKWGKRVAEVPLWAWQASMYKRIERQWGNDQAGYDSDEHTGGP